jgi:hypothetical protein
MPLEGPSGVIAMFEIMNANHTLGLAAGALSSLFWTAAYALIIRQGERDRLHGMPLVALGANLSWELIFLAVTLANGAHDVRLALLLPWTVLDLAIVVQCFRYGRADFRHPLVARHFHAGLACILLLSGAVLLSFVRELRDAIGWYAAFGQNLMMSALFVAMLLRRDSLRGQSIYIAIAKLLGTFFAFVLALFWSPPTLNEHWEKLLPDGYHPISPLIVTLYTGIFVLDVAYIALVHRKSRELGIDPWRF